ncbi:MAG: hypothetical protein ISS95_00175 [Candidatus Aenigmarchaeota archaeon]|nr:hypothetical protein [Candidatus Aenigmarchaeota archaeon]
MIEGQILSLVRETRQFFRNAQNSDLKIGDYFEFEPGKDWEIILQKSRRAIELIPDILERGYFTVAIELSFYSIERSFEAVVMKKTGQEKFRAKHAMVFFFASEKKIISENLAAELSRLWSDYRGEQYYKELVSTKILAEKMFEIARMVSENISKEI